MSAPDFSKMGGEGIPSAVGRAFFSLGLGTGAIMIHGFCLRRDASIARIAVVAVPLHAVGLI